MELYKDENYANGRLTGTVVRYDSKPVTILAMGGGKVIASDLVTGNQFEFKYGDKKLNIDPVPLGYINEGTSAYYACRCPVRKDWKQGLRGQTFRAIQIGYNTPIQEMLAMVNLGKTILGDYPKLGKVVDILKAGAAMSVAFSRELAFDKAFNIWLKGEYNIGKFDPAKQQVQLDEKHYWADEFVKEVFN